MGNALLSSRIMPEASVVIPVYQGEAYIEATLRSLQAQTFSDFEVLCIDDCSSDRSEDIILAMATGDPRIRYVRTSENLGDVPRVLGRYLQQVRGTYLAYSSQDDSFSPNWLSRMIELAKETSADAVVPDLVFYDDGGVTRWLRNSHREPMSGTEAFLLSLDWTIPGNALFRRSLYDRHGFEDFGMYADEYTWRFYFLKSGKVAFADGLFRYYHGNPDAITRKLSPGMLDRAYNDYRLWRLVEDHAPLSPWATDYAQQAFRSLRHGFALMHRNASLRTELPRLQKAVAAMRSDVRFLDRLRESFGSSVKGSLAVLGLYLPSLFRLDGTFDHLRR